SHLLGEQYDYKVTDLQSLQKEVAQNMATALRLQFSGEERTRLAQPHTKNAEAYQLYLKGRYFWNKRTTEGMKKGLECFEQAIRLDPDYAAAYVGLADCYGVLSQVGDFSPNDVMPKAKAAALDELRIDEQIAEEIAYVAILGV